VADSDVTRPEQAGEEGQRMTKSEAQTRSELIDHQLAQAGWNVKDPTQVVEELTS